MKNICIILLFSIAGIGSAFAQEWQTDITVAKEMARKNDMPIILVFQGSDWCAPCIKLDRSVWSSEEFKAYAKEHYVMLKADFPRRKRNTLSKIQVDRNKALAEKYNRNGIFPFVLVMDHKGKVLGETGYKKSSPGEYIKELDAYIK